MMQRAQDTSTACRSGHSEPLQRVAGSVHLHNVLQRAKNISTKCCSGSKTQATSTQSLYTRFYRKQSTPLLPCQPIVAYVLSTATLGGVAFTSHFQCKFDVTRKGACKVQSGMCSFWQALLGAAHCKTFLLHESTVSPN